MPVETDKYVNATTDTEVPKWVTTGANPWLNADDASYIRSSTLNQKSGDYSFPASAGAPTDHINSVALRFRDKYGVNPGAYEIFVYDGSAWTDVGNLTPLNLAFTDEADFDVSAILNSWAKINACLVYVKNLGNVTHVPYISELRRIVDYTPSGAVKPPTIMLDKGPHPRTKTIFKRSLKRFFG